MRDQTPKQAIVKEGTKLNPNQAVEHLALYNPDGTPWVPQSGSNGSALVYVNAGDNLDAARVSGAESAPHYWMFDAGVDVGDAGVNVTNGAVGDIYFVEDV